jgi:carbon storage regulator
VAGNEGFFRKYRRESQLHELRSRAGAIGTLRALSPSINLASLRRPKPSLLVPGSPQLSHVTIFTTECAMLVLSRKKAEQIQIGDNITITILKIKGTAVQIGVEAPIHVKVLRSELSFDAPSAATPSNAAASVAVTQAAVKQTRKQTGKQTAVKTVALAPAISDGRRSSGADRDDESDPGHTLTVPVNRLDRVTLGETLVFRG